MLINYLKTMGHFRLAEGEAAGATGGTSSVSADTNSNATASATVSTTAGDAAKVSNDQSSAAASVPAGIGSQAADTSVNSDFRAEWPDDLKKDPYLSGFKTPQDIAKALIENKKMVGQKLGIPGPDATPEAKAAFYEALGVPKDPAGYEFTQPDDLPDALKETYDQEHADKWAKRFKDLGIPKDAAAALRKEFFAEVSEEMKGVMAQNDASEATFNKLSLEIYGDANKANEALQNVRTMVEKHVPANLKAAMAEMPSAALLAIASVIRGETMALSGEDKTISRDNGASSDGKTVAQLRDEARSLQALPEYSSPFTAKGKTAHDEAVAKVKSIYDRIGKMSA